MSTMRDMIGVVGRSWTASGGPGWFTWQRFLVVSVIAGVLAVVLYLSLAFLMSSTPSQNKVEVSQPIDVQETVAGLTRTGIRADGVNIDAVYAPAFLMQALGEALPGESEVIFFLMESIHEDLFVTSPPQPALLINGLGDYLPADSTPTQNDIHHRTTKYRFVVPTLTANSLTDGTSGELTLVVPTPDGLETSTNSYTWDLPLDVKGANSQVTDPANMNASPGVGVDESTLSLSAVTKSLRRTKGNVGVDGVNFDFAVTYATVDYFEAALPSSAAVALQPATSVVFLISESTHTRDLPEDLPALILEMNGSEYEPDMIRKMVSSPHHRATVVRFPVDPAQGRSGEGMVLKLPDESSVARLLPIVSQAEGGISPFGITWTLY